MYKEDVTMCIVLKCGQPQCLHIEKKEARTLLNVNLTLVTADLPAFCLLRTMKQLLASILFCLVGMTGTAQSLRAGLEQDALPWITGGYYAGGFVGTQHLRARILTAYVHKPSLIVPKGFTNNTVTAWAFVGDYFLKEDWSGFWLSGGLVRWNSTIQSDTRIETAKYSQFLLNGSIGYQWLLGQHFYVSPWAGMHILIHGPTRITADGKSFKAPLLNPEASLKFGWYFGGKSH